MFDNVDYYLKIFILFLLQPSLNIYSEFQHFCSYEFDNFWGVFYYFQASNSITWK